jgi:hypothetical protein
MAVPGGGAPMYGRPAQIRFDVIGEAFSMMQRQIGNWALASLISLFCIGAIIAVLFAIQTAVIVSVSVAGGATGSGMIQNFTVRLVSTFFGLITSILAGAVLVFFLGGMYRMAIKQMRNEPFTAGDLFSVMDVAGPLLTVGVIISAIASIPNLLGILPIPSFLTFLPVMVFTWIVYGMTMFAAPLVADRRMQGLDAIKLSVETLKSQAVMAVLFYVVASIIGGLGLLACCIGVLFTYPVYVLCIALTYRDFFLGGAAPNMPPPGGYPPPGSYPPPGPSV